MQPSTPDSRDSSVHGAIHVPAFGTGSLADSRASAMLWYTTPVPSDRGDSAKSISMKDATAKRAMNDVAQLLSLPDDVITHDLAQLDVEKLARLAKLSAAALARVVPVGKPIPADELPVVAATPALKDAFMPPVMPAAAPIKPPVALDQKKWVDFPLVERTEINHNTLRLRFGLPTADLGLPVGMHIFLKARIADKPVMRAYTPVGFGPGYVEFIIKVYFAAPPKFPEGGKLTQHMHAMKIGDCLAFKGPLGELDFDANLAEAAAPKHAPMSFQHNKALGGHFKHLGFIAGGSGITPCLQVAVALLKLDRDITVSLLYANQTAEDILCQEEIDEIAKDPRVRVWYTVDRPADGWKYSAGFIDENMCREHLPPPSDDTFIFMCGPPPMLKFACRPNLQEKIGHLEAHVLAF